MLTRLRRRDHAGTVHQPVGFLQKGNPNEFVTACEHFVISASDALAAGV